MEDLRAHSLFLKSLAALKSPQTRLFFLRSCTPEQVKILVEIAHNVLYGTVPLTAKERRRLIPFAKFVRDLVKRRTTQTAKKTLIQSGTGVPFGALIIPALRLLSASLTD